jgi:hypothetical protein
MVHPGVEHGNIALRFLVIVSPKMNAWSSKIQTRGACALARNKKKQMAKDGWSLFWKVVWMTIILGILLVASSAIFLGAWNYAVPALGKSVGSAATFANIDYATAIVSMILFWIMLSPVALPALEAIYRMCVDFGHDAQTASRARYSTAYAAHDTWRVKNTAAPMAAAAT